MRKPGIDEAGDSDAPYWMTTSARAGRRRCILYIEDGRPILIATPDWMEAFS